jgi:hypothetical protein
MTTRADTWVRPYIAHSMITTRAMMTTRADTWVRPDATATLR